MPEVGIIVDSTSCLPPELVRQYEIGVIPCAFTIDGKSYLDVDLTSEEFWRLFCSAQTITTSGVSPQVFAEMYAESGRKVDSIVCLTVSAAFSAINRIAQQAAETARSDNPRLTIEVVDSKTSAGALGFIALEAARAAAQGRSLPEVLQVTRDMISRAKYITVYKTLKYLIKGGRFPATAKESELENVRLFIGQVSGTGVNEDLGKAMGDQRAFVRLVDMVKDYTDVTRPLHVMVHYSDKIEEGERLKEMITRKYNCTELYMTPYTPVMACHTGPVVALAFYS